MEMPLWFIPFFVVAMWVAVEFVISSTGGWMRLARSYATTRDPGGTRFGPLSAKIGWASYSNILYLWVSPEGLYMRMMFLFRLFHPTLLIPWKDMHDAQEHTFLWMRFLAIRLGDPPGVRVSELPMKLVGPIEEHLQPLGKTIEKSKVPTWSKARTLMAYAGIWVLLAAVLLIGLGSLNWVTYRRLASRGVRGTAKIVELLPKDHHSAVYEYDVSGKSFKGQKCSWPPNPILEEMVAGQSVQVWYDPERPEISVLGDPQPILENETVTILLAAVLGPTVIVLGMFLTVRKMNAR